MAIDISQLKAEIESGELQAEFETDRQGEGMTAFRIAAILNEILAELGIEKKGKLYQVTPQMMYNYAKNGMIVKGVKGQKRFSEDEVDAFVRRFVAKLV